MAPNVRFVRKGVQEEFVMSVVVGVVNVITEERRSQCVRGCWSGAISPRSVTATEETVSQG